jgi:PAS domain S-box-containing protein
MGRRSATEHLQTMSENRRREIRLVWPQRLIHVGSWEWDLKTKKSNWSLGLYRILNLMPQQVTPRTSAFLNCVHPDDREKVVRALGKALVGEQAYNVDHRIVWPDGSVRLVHGEAEVTFDEKGRPIHILGTLQDITDVRQAYEPRLCVKAGRKSRR